MGFGFHPHSLCCLLICFQRCYMEALGGWRDAKLGKPFISFKGPFTSLSNQKTGWQAMELLTAAAECCPVSVLHFEGERMTCRECAWQDLAPNLRTGCHSSCYQSHMSPWASFPSLFFAPSSFLTVTPVLHSSSTPAVHPCLPTYFFPLSDEQTIRPRNWRRAVTTETACHNSWQQAFSDSRPPHMSVGPVLRPLAILQTLCQEAFSPINTAQAKLGKSSKGCTGGGHQCSDPWKFWCTITKVLPVMPLKVVIFTTNMLHLIPGTSLWFLGGFHSYGHLRVQIFAWTKSSRNAMVFPSR